MTRPEITVCSDGEAVAARAAAHIAERARASNQGQGRFRLAVSGGHTPWAMLALLARTQLEWSAIDIFQVDERIAPSGDANRNLTHLRESLGTVPARLHPMPVEDQDLEAAAWRYAQRLPERFDLVHLGLGPDGHTASLVPADPVLEIADRDVALTNSYQGNRRMTLTYRGLARAQEILWVVTGSDKAVALRRLLDGDTDIPAARVACERALVVADRSAAADLPP